MPASFFPLSGLGKILRAPISCIQTLPTVHAQLVRWTCLLESQKTVPKSTLKRRSGGRIGKLEDF
jgi:hypothetical protein